MQLLSCSTLHIKLTYLSCVLFIFFLSHYICSTKSQISSFFLLTHIFQGLKPVLSSYQSPNKCFIFGGFWPGLMSNSQSPATSHKLCCSPFIPSTFLKLQSPHGHAFHRECLYLRLHSAETHCETSICVWAIYEGCVPRRNQQECARVWFQAESQRG